VKVPRTGRRGVAATVALSFIVGILAGAIYWALGIPSPAPPWIGLTGLLGIVIGEVAGRRVRSVLAQSRKSRAT
jgi:XapX domain-containing protein